MTKKDYKAIAEILNAEYTRYDGTGVDDTEAKCAVCSIVGKFNAYLASDNPRFDKDKFVKACGIE